MIDLGKELWVVASMNKAKGILSLGIEFGDLMIWFKFLNKMPVCMAIKNK